MKSMKWSLFLVLTLLCLSVCIASVTADNWHKPNRYQYHQPYAAPVWGYTAPVWEYTVPILQYTKPVLQPAVQVGSKIYYSLSTGRYYSFATNSFRLPVGVWWI